MRKYVVIKESSDRGRIVSPGDKVNRLDEWKSTPEWPIATFETPVGEMFLFNNDVKLDVPDRVPVMVMRNKTNEHRYLAAHIDVGDWDDENLDVTLKDIGNAYMIIRNDFTPPTIAEDFEDHKRFHAELKRITAEKFGNIHIGLDFESACEHYDPVNIDITPEQFEQAMENLEEL